jgi:hypothetical protein
LALLACAQLLHSQNLKDSLAAPGLKSLLKLKLSADFGLEWEKRISAVSSISLFGGCSFGRQSNDYADLSAAVIASPDIFAEYRNYYNLQKRRKSNKITRNNAANFLFGRIESVFAVNGLNSFNLLFIQGWGIQRNIDRKILVGYHAGILEHFYFDKPVTGGFHYVKIEPLNSFSVTLIF